MSSYLAGGLPIGNEGHFKGNSIAVAIEEAVIVIFMLKGCHNEAV